MKETIQSHSLLIVTKDTHFSSFVTTLLPPDLFHPIHHVDCGYEAKRTMIDAPADIIIVDSGNGYDTEVVVDLAESDSTVLVAVPAPLWDEISYQMEPLGILTLPKPLEQFTFYTMIKAACAVRHKIKALTEKTVRLEEKMEEVRVVNRAKMLLIQHQGMDEPEAHRFIEKEAMDRGLRKSTVANSIIRKYQD